MKHDTELEDKCLYVNDRLKQAGINMSILEVQEITDRIIRESRETIFSFSDLLDIHIKLLLHNNHMRTEEEYLRIKENLAFIGDTDTPGVFRRALRHKNKNTDWKKRLSSLANSGHRKP